MIQVPDPGIPLAAPLPSYAPIPDDNDIGVAASPVLAPGLVRVDDDDEEENDTPRRFFRAAPPANHPPGIPPEPWYYGFLEVYAKIVMFLGIAVSTPIIAPGIAIGASALQARSSGGLEMIVSFLIAIWGGLILVAVLRFTAPILLAVDAARNLRVIRYTQGSVTSGAA